jgi:serine/threonine protein phosphatase PrpC
LKFPKWLNKSGNPFSVGSKSDVGRVRSETQDSFGVFPPEVNGELVDRLFVVADGMGGHQHGSQASAMAVETLGKAFIGHVEGDVSERLLRVFNLANDRIFQHSQQLGPGESMGTTCSVVAMVNGHFWIGHVGDSRIYLVDQKQITQLTEDHTLVNELVREGILTEEEAQVDPRKHSLLQAMGVADAIRPDVFEIPTLQSGERLVICSDGLAVVSDDVIGKIVRENDAQKACDELVNLANRQGGPDNVTVVVLGTA